MVVRGGLSGLLLVTACAAAVAQPVRSEGRNVRLEDALARIMPPGEAARTRLEGVADRRVSWSAGADWRVVLDRSLAAAGLRLSGTPEGYVIVPALAARQGSERQGEASPSPVFAPLPRAAASVSWPGFVLEAP